MIRKTGLIRTMAEAQALYASEIKRVKGLVNRYLPDPRVFGVSVPSMNLPDAFIVLKPVTYASDQKTVSVPASIEIIPHINGIYVYDQLSELDPELRIDWKLGILEDFTHEWFSDKFGNATVESMVLINRVRKGEPPNVSVSSGTESTSLKFSQDHTREKGERLGLSEFTNALPASPMVSTLRGPVDGDPGAILNFGNLHWDPKELAQGRSLAISQNPEGPDTLTLSYRSQGLPDPAKVASINEPEKPFFFTDTKQIKVKKDKKKKSKKTKPSKSKRK